MNKITYIIVFITLFFISCRTSRKYNRPQIETAVAYRTAEPKQTDLSETTATGIAELPWKSFFTDPVLQSIVDSVLLHNYDLSVALNNVRMNDEYLRQSKVAWLPSITAGVSASSNYFSENSLNGNNGFNLNNTIGSKHIDDYSTNMGLSWEVDIWGKAKNHKAAAMATWLQSKEAAKYVQTQLISTTASAYYNLLMLDEQLKIAHKNLALNDSIVSLIRVQMQNGEATALAVQQAEVLQKETSALIPTLEQAIFIQENALGILMNREPGNIMRKGSGPDGFNIPEKFVTGIPAEILSRRPDVRESEFALRAANARVGVAQANMYPSLNINASTGLNAFQIGNWLALPTSIFGNVAGNLMQPVFNKRKLKTELNISKLTYERTAADFRYKVLNAVTEVSDALVKTEKLREKITIAKSQYGILQQAVPNAKLLFSNGMASYLEVIAVQQNLLQNELSLADLKRQQVTAYVQLYKALGGGVD